MPFEKYIRRLPGHFRLILLCGLVAGLVTLIVTTVIPPTYEAEADLVIIKTGSDINFDPKFKSISEFDVAQTVVDQAARRKALALIATSPELLTAVFLQSEAQSNDARPLSDWQRDVTARSDGDLIRLTVKSNSAEKAARLANNWAGAFVNRVNAIYRDTSLAPAEIQKQADNAKADYDVKQTAIVAYLANSRTNQLYEELREKKQKLADKAALRLQLDRLLADARSLRERLAGGSGTSGDQLASLLLEANSFNAASNLGTTQSGITTSQNSSAPAPINLQIQIAPSSGASPAEQLSNLDALIAALEARRTLVESENSQQLQQEVNTLTAQLEQETSQLQVLTQARDLTWSTFTTLSNKAAEVNVAAQANDTLVKPAVTAIPPTEPVEPRKWLYTGLAAAAGLVLGIVLALLLQVFNIKSIRGLVSGGKIEPGPVLSPHGGVDSDK